MSHSWGSQRSDRQEATGSELHGRRAVSKRRGWSLGREGLRGLRPKSEEAVPWGGDSNLAEKLNEDVAKS